MNASHPSNPESSGGIAPRILIAHNVPPGRTGGMSRIMSFIHDEIAHDRPGWQIDWFCADRPPAHRGGFFGRFAFPWHLCRFLRAETVAGRRYDVVNVHEPVAALVVAARRFLGRPAVVVTSHGLEAHAWAVDQEEARLGRKPLSWRSRLARPLTILWPARFALRRADHVFCLSSEDRETLADVFGVPTEQTTRIFPGVSRAFDVAPHRDYARAGRLVFAGTWRPHKGTADLIPAFAKLAAKHPAATLTILGAGFTPEVVQAQFPASARERVIVLPFATEAQVMETLAASDLFVLPSLFEGTPLTLLEAMAAGLPIVTTETCGMRDVIRHGENGLLVPIRSPERIVAALDLLMADLTLRERLGKAARADALEKYDWNTVASGPEAVYQKLISTGLAASR